jgi:tetratricopeptide (TPR) repeat protein
MTLSDYRRRLDSGTIDPIDFIEQGTAAAIGGEPRYLVSRTWQLSLDALRLQGIPEAAHLLRLLSCWSGDPLPLSLLAGAELGTDLRAARIESALQGLIDQSLTELVPDARSLRTHSVLLSSVARVVSDDQREQLATTAARLLAEHLPEVPERGPQDPLVIVLAPHVRALLRRVHTWRLAGPAASAAVENALRLVIALHRSGDFDSALTVAREAAEFSGSLLGDEHVLTLRLRQRIGRSLCRLGQYEESRAQLTGVLDACERVLGSDAPETLDTCLALGAPLFNLGYQEEALVLRRRAAAGRKILFGNTHPLTLYSRMALLEFASGPEADDIIATGPQLIQDCRGSLGDNSELTLGAELNYAYALFSAGRSREAAPHARAAFNGYERVFGPHYPITINALFTLTNTLAALNEHAEALACAEEMTQRYSRVLGPAHPWTRNASRILDEISRAANRD